MVKSYYRPPSLCLQLTLFGLLMISIVQQHGAGGVSIKDIVNNVLSFFPDLFRSDDRFLKLLKSCDPNVKKVPKEYKVPDTGIVEGTFNERQIKLAQAIWNGLYNKKTDSMTIRFFSYLENMIDVIQKNNAEVLKEAVTLLIIIMSAANGQNEGVKRIPLLIIQYGSNQIRRNAGAYVCERIREHYAKFPIENDVFKSNTFLHNIEANSPVGKKPFQEMLDGADDTFERCYETSTGRDMVEYYIIAACFNGILMENSYADLIPALQETINKLKTIQHKHGLM